MTGGWASRILKAIPTSFSAATWWTAFAGGVGGLVGFLTLGTFLGSFFQMGLHSHPSLVELLLGQSLLTMSYGLGACTAILAADNHQSLRGRWYRDLGSGIATFFGLCFAGGLLAICVLNTIAKPLVSIGVGRGLAWAIVGVGMGVGIGILRRDPVQRNLGALGGAIGGLLSGLIVDAFLAISYTDAAFGLATLIGATLTGAFVGLFMRVVQDTMQDAWLLGVTTGPYEGKRYPLNTPRVSVGRSEEYDISLYRESELAMQSGTFVACGDGWRWQGDAVEINGIRQTDVVLRPGDTIRLGGTNFRFQTRDGFPAPVAGRPGPSTPSSTLYPPRVTPGPVPLPAVPASAPPTSAPATSQTPATPSPFPTPAGNSTVAASTGAALAGAALAGAALRALKLHGEHGSFALPKPGEMLRLGRAADNDIQIPDPTVSGYHGRLENRGGQITLTDLESTNGTRVNGFTLAPQTPQPLRPGDQIFFGGCEYEVTQ